LWDRLHGRTHKKEANEDKQILSNPQEATLVDWIGYQAAIAKPLDREDIRSLVLDISGVAPGLNWIHRFQQRHPEICASRPGNLDPKRAQNFNPTNVAHFYKLLKDVYDAYPDIPPEHIWNMDEKGVQFGGGRKRSKKYYHLRDMKRSKFYRVRSDNLELMTVIECVSPSGLFVPPSFVLSSGPIPSFPDLSSKIAAIATSPNGWTDNEIGTAWFMETFIPFANDHKVTDAPVVLLLDGHNSHESDTFCEAAFQHNIIVIAFPSKCTHKLQPLDVVVFAQTQRHWSSHCDNCIIHHIKMDRYNIIPEYMEVHPRSMTPNLLRSAFSTTGIFPFNDTLFTDDDFAPAKSFSYVMHAPQSFPPEVPTSSPAASDVSDVEMSSDESDSAESVAPDAPAAQTHFGWESNSDDFDFEDPQPPNLTAPTAATTPTEALPIPSQLVMPAVPITGTITSSSPLVHATCTTLASCPSRITPSTGVPPIPAPTVSHYVGASGSGSPGPWDASSGTQATRYYTRSRASQMASLSLGSSPALSVSVALDPTQAPQPQSIQELLSENRRLKLTLDLMAMEVAKAKANNDASNAHCTIMTRAATTAKADLDRQKRTTRRAVKSSARYVAHPAIEDEWNASQLEKARRAKVAAETEAQKATEEALREARIQLEIQTRIFSSAL
jgi:hypothetical protein